MFSVEENGGQRNPLNLGTTCRTEAALLFNMETPFLHEVHGDQLLVVKHHIHISSQGKTPDLFPSIVQVEAKAYLFKAGIVWTQVDHSDR